MSNCYMFHLCCMHCELFANFLMRGNGLAFNIIISVFDMKTSLSLLSGFSTFNFDMNKLENDQ